MMMTKRTLYIFAILGVLAMSSGCITDEMVKDWCVVDKANEVYGWVDLKIDVNNCGACGIACSGGQQCKDGKCTCPEETPDLCGEDEESKQPKQCVDLNTDSLNCGSCENKCNEWQKCEEGKCVCDETKLPANSREHCGVTCDTPKGESCESDEFCIKEYENYHCAENAECSLILECKRKQECAYDSNKVIICKCKEEYIDIEGQCLYAERPEIIIDPQIKLVEGENVNVNLRLSKTPIYPVLFEINHDSFNIGESLNFVIGEIDNSAENSEPKLKIDSTRDNKIYSESEETIGVNITSKSEDPDFDGLSESIQLTLSEADEPGFELEALSRNNEELDEEPEFSSELEHLETRECDLCSFCLNQDVRSEFCTESAADLCRQDNEHFLQFKLKLKSIPTDDVTLKFHIDKEYAVLTVVEDYHAISKDDLSSEGQLTFTSQNWDQPKYITIFGKDDGNNISSDEYHLDFDKIESNDPNYNNTSILPRPVLIKNSDNDQPYITINGIVADDNYNAVLEINENTTKQLNIGLSNNIEKDMKFLAEIENENGQCKILEGEEGNKTESHTFKLTKDKQIEQMTVIAVDNPTINHSPNDKCQLTVKSLEKINFNNVEKEIQAIQNFNIIDDENSENPFSVTVNPTLITENSDYCSTCITSSQLCVISNSSPVKEVSFNVSSDRDDCVQYQNSIVLEADSSQNLQKCIDVESKNDGKPEDNKQITFTVKATSDDLDFNEKVQTVYLNQMDTNAREFMVSGFPDKIAEKEESEFNVKLRYKPEKDVLVNIASLTQDSRININTPNLTFTASNWNVNQSVKIRIGDDNITNINNYANIKISTEDGVSYTNSFRIIDDETPGIIVSCDCCTDLFPSCVGGMQVSDSDSNNVIRGYLASHDDDDDTIYCYIKLSSKPAKDVKVTLSLSNESKSSTLNLSTEKLSLSKNTLTFTSSNYNTNQTVAIKNTRTSSSPIPSNAVTRFYLQAYSTDSHYKVNNTYNSDKMYSYNLCHYLLYKPYSDGLSHYNFSNLGKITLPPGKYRLHAWGASGGLPTYKSMTHINGDWNCKNNGGLGAYVYGTLQLTAQDTLYVRAGGAGSDCDKSDHSDHELTAGYNGGGEASTGGGSYRGVGGGGATDFCIGSTDCKDDNNHYPYRILVAGGGGGAPGVRKETNDNHTYCYKNDRSHGGNAGLVNSSGDRGTHKEGTSDQAFVYGGGYTSSMNCGYGISQPFGRSGTKNEYASRPYGGGGGGWYCGCTSTNDNVREIGGGGGSSYVLTSGNKGFYGSKHNNTKYALTNYGSRIGNNARYFDTNNSYIFGIYGEPTKFGNIGNGYAVIEVMNE